MPCVPSANTSRLWRVVASLHGFIRGTPLMVGVASCPLFCGRARGRVGPGSIPGAVLRSSQTMSESETDADGLTAAMGQQNSTIINGAALQAQLEDADADEEDDTPEAEQDGLTRETTVDAGDTIVADDGTEGEVIAVVPGYGPFGQPMDLIHVEWPDVGHRVANADEIADWYEVR